MNTELMSVNDEAFYHEGYVKALNDVLDYIDTSDEWSPALELHIGKLMVKKVSQLSDAYLSP